MGSLDIGKWDLTVLFFMLVSSVFKVSNGGVYMVGDSAGWTTIANVDYKEWAQNKTFQVGDTIVFNYDHQFHDVMRVSHAEYDACNVSSSPVSIHTTGNDSIMIDTHGHHFFVCSFPGHCQAGQKVDINVHPPSVGPTPSPPSSPVTIYNSPLTTVLPPSPSPSLSATPPIMVFQLSACLILIFTLFFQVFGVFGLA